MAWHQEEQGVLQQQGPFALRSRSGVGSGATVAKGEKKEVLLEEWGFPGDSAGKNPPAPAGDTGDMGSVPGSGRCPGEGNGNPLQYC